MQQFGVTSHVKTETVFPMIDGEMTFRQRATSLTLNLASSNDLAAALRVAHESMAPAPVEMIEEWLARLSVKTARRKDSAHGDELALSVYTDHLRDYPGDVVREVLSSYRGTWFPTWGELAERLDELTEVRAMIRDRLLEMAHGVQRKQITHDPVAEHLAKLRDELAAAERVASRYPELADSSARKRQAIADEIAKLEGRAATPSSP
jgi:hypothetical protein